MSEHAVSAGSSPLRRIVKSLQDFTAHRRTLALVGVGVIIAIGAAIVYFSTRPTMVPLYTNLSGADANAVAEQVKADGVDYRVGNDGSSILVEQSKVAQERMKTAAAGLPADSDKVGYGLLDGLSATSSDFQEDTTWLRAMEGELANSVQSLNPVTAASVKITQPKDTVFQDSRTDPTASVFVELRTGTTLDDDQIEAIRQLVSASIDGLTADNVAIVDNSGKTLAAIGSEQNGSRAGVTKQEQAEQASTSGAVSGMLDTVLGSGNSTVAVNVDVSGESAKRTTEKFATGKDVSPLSQKKSSETYTGSGSGASGVLGADNVSVDSSNSPGAGADGTYSKQSTENQNAVDKTTEERTIPSGATSRKTIAVAVDRTALGTIKVADLKQMIGNAAGADAARGDAISVSVVDFARADPAVAQAAIDEAKAEQTAQRKQALLRQGIIGGAIVLFGLLILLAVLLARRSVKASPSNGSTELVAPEHDLPPLSDFSRSLPETEPATTLLSATTAPVALTAPPEPEPLAIEPAELTARERRQELSAWAQRDPRRLASHLKGYMDQGKEEAL